MIKYPKNVYGTEKYMKCCNFFTNPYNVKPYRKPGTFNICEIRFRNGQI